MKKLILSVSAMLAFGFANAQGYYTNGVHDDFATSTDYENGLNGEGIHWFETSGGTTLLLERQGVGSNPSNSGYMKLTTNNAGGCNGCYPLFGVQFGNDGATPTPNTFTIDLSGSTPGNGNIVLDIENTSMSDVFFAAITLEDINGNKAEVEPYVDDLTPSTTWGDPQRKSLLGFTLYEEERKTVTIDITSVAGKIGGLTKGAYNCSSPYGCPETSYGIDPTKIKAILFTVNFGVDDIFLSEDTDYSTDTFWDGPTIQSHTGEVYIHDFRIGQLTGSADAQTENSLKVYPNPADAALTVAFDASTPSEVSLKDVLGNTVYSTTGNAGANKITVNTTDLTSGVYVLNVATETGNTTRKVTIK